MIYVMLVTYIFAVDPPGEVDGRFGRRGGAVGSQRVSHPVPGLDARQCWREAGDFYNKVDHCLKQRK